MPFATDNARMLVALLLAMAVAFVFDRGCERLGRPPGFEQPWRRMLATLLLTWVLFFAVFLPVATFGAPQDIDFENLSYSDLFLSHEVLLVTVGLWLLLAYVRLFPRADDPPDDPEPDDPEPQDVSAALLLRTANPLREVVVGVVAGAGAWAAALGALILFGVVMALIGRHDIVAADGPAPLIVFVAGLPIWVRLAISLSAGVVEELFFRGFLQPRVGIGLSTLCFVLGHLSYGQPVMLIGLTVLSLLYARLTEWRGNIWAAVVAHTLFDVVQLLVIIPSALKGMAAASGGA